MNPLLLAVSALSLLGFVVHITAGEKQIARPIMGSSVDPVARHTMYVCWHAVSAQMLLAAVLTGWAGLQGDPAAATLVGRSIGALYLAYAALFLVIARRSKIPRAIWKLPQWGLFAPAGVLGLLA